MRRFFTFLAFLTISLFSLQDLFSQSLTIYHIDVGQGDATFFVVKNDSGAVINTVLIDGGVKKYGYKIINFIKDTLGLNTINYVIASHYDFDHVGGLAEILRYSIDTPGRLTIDSVFDRGDTLYPHPKQGIGYKQQAKRFGASRKTLKPCMEIILFDDLANGSHTGQYSIKMTCLCVNGSVYTSPFSSYKIVTTTTVDENDLSTGFSISYGQFIYLTCGDIGGKRGNQSGGCDGSYGCKFFDIETNVSALFAGGGGVSAYKTNHHGSRCSTNPKWVSDLKAPVAINSSGKYDNYKHPREEVVRELNNSPAMVNFFLTAPVNYYRRSLPPKGVLNPAPGRPIVLTVNRVNNDTPIIFKSIFNVQGVYYRKP